MQTTHTNTKQTNETQKILLKRADRVEDVGGQREAGTSYIGIVSEKQNAQDAARGMQIGKGQRAAGTAEA